MSSALTVNQKSQVTMQRLYFEDRKYRRVLRIMKDMAEQQTTTEEQATERKQKAVLALSTVE